MPFRSTAQACEYLRNIVFPNSPETLIYSAIVLSHCTHWLSTLVLWQIGRTLLVPGTRNGNGIAMVAALLHVFSSAGIFLSAPYTESTFSFLNMSGFLLYVLATRQWDEQAHGRSCLLTVAAGLVFGCATMVRTNGILSGIPFALDFVALVVRSSRHHLRGRDLLRLSAIVMGGTLVGCGVVVPQFLAYRSYCVLEQDKRPWCSQRPPTIFGWVQSHYWYVYQTSSKLLTYTTRNVGPFRYWTLSNAPLFLLAAPTLFILISSAIDTLPLRNKRTNASAISKHRTDLTRQSLILLAAPQLILAVLALTTYHVQIITRLASGYPQWYIWLAQLVHEQGQRRDSQHAPVVFVRWMVVYAFVQGGLFASFLPPA